MRDLVLKPKSGVEVTQTYRQYQALISKAEVLRVNKYYIEDAINAYLEALELAEKYGYSQLQILHMLGVCYRLVGEYQYSLDWLKLAFNNTNEVVDKGNIWRDMGATYLAWEVYDLAQYCLSMSAKLLRSYSPKYWGYGATIGFKARIFSEIGEKKQAKKYFALARRILRKTENREVDLYNELHYSSFLSSYGQPVYSRCVAIRALLLASSYGSNAHRIRAMCLLVGGSKLEAKATQLYKK